GARVEADARDRGHHVGRRAAPPGLDRGLPARTRARSACVAQSPVGARRCAHRPAVGGRRAQRSPLAPAATRESLPFLTEIYRTPAPSPPARRPALFLFFPAARKSRCPTPSSILPMSSFRLAPPLSRPPVLQRSATTHGWG